MASAGSKAASGAATGAAAGMAAGPWGALIGGVVGGAAGYLQGDDPNAPKAPNLVAPQYPGSVSTGYGGWTIDPVTGRQVYSQNADIAGSAQQRFRNSAMQSIMLGQGGAGASDDLDAQIAAIQEQIARYQRGGTSKTGDNAIKPSDFVQSPSFLNADGSIMSGTAEEFNANKTLNDEFIKQTGGTYGKGPGDFLRWAKDAYQNAGIDAKLKEYNNALKTGKGNDQTTNDALANAQAQLAQLTKLKESGAGTIASLQNNPLQKYLDNSGSKMYGPGANQGPNGAQPTGYSWDGSQTPFNMQSDSNMPWINDQLDKDRAQMLQDPTLPFSTSNDWSPDGGAAGSSAFNMAAGAVGGQEKIQANELDPNGGAMLSRSLASKAAQQFRANLLMQQNQAAARGMSNSSSADIAGAGNALNLANMQNDALYQGSQYQQALADSHFSQVAAAQAGNNAANQQAFGNYLGLGNAQLAIDNTRYGRQNNEFTLQQALKDKWRAQALQSLGVKNTQEDRVYNRSALADATSRGQDLTQFHSNLEGLGYLSGQNAQSLQAELGRGAQYTSQVGQGQGVGMTMGGAQTAQQTAQAGLNWQAQNAQYQAGIQQSQANQNALMQGLGAAAQGYAAYTNKPPATANGTAQTTAPPAPTPYTDPSANPYSNKYTYPVPGQ